MYIDKQVHMRAYIVKFKNKCKSERRKRREDRRKNIKKLISEN